MALVVSLVLIFSEGLIRIITLGLRKPYNEIGSLHEILTVASTTNYPFLLQQV